MTSSAALIHGPSDSIPEALWKLALLKWFCEYKRAGYAVCTGTSSGPSEEPVGGGAMMHEMQVADEWYVEALEEYHRLCTQGDASTSPEGNPSTDYTEGLHE